ncbi:hypothetical protein Bca4012_026447 [Brassica carinata]
MIIISIYPPTGGVLRFLQLRNGCEFFHSQHPNPTSSPNPTPPQLPAPVPEPVLEPVFQYTTADEVTVKMFLASPRRDRLPQLHPDRPINTLWFDDDSSVATSVRQIFERDFKEPHANWIQIPDHVVRQWFNSFATIIEEQALLIRSQNSQLGAAFRTSFPQKKWYLIRTLQPRVDSHRGIWFPCATSRFSFVSWLATLNRLSTGDTVKTLNSGIQVNCILCDQNIEEPRQHLFFSCTTTPRTYGSHWPHEQFKLNAQRSGMGIFL